MQQILTAGYWFLVIGKWMEIAQESFFSTWGRLFPQRNLYLSVCKCVFMWQRSVIAGSPQLPQHELGVLDAHLKSILWFPFTSGGAGVSCTESERWVRSTFQPVERDQTLTLGDSCLTCSLLVQLFPLMPKVPYRWNWSWVWVLFVFTWQTPACVSWRM